ncbi:MAG TPA: hypothetical protein ENH80_09195 [Phycisphaerae bacterium]|nr:hypothetical protein [Phycisphaerae bacterium]
MFCAEWSLVKKEFKLTTVIPLRCRCWHCDECRPLRTYQLVSDAKRGDPDLFITLTSRRRPGLTPDEAAVLLAHAWRKVRAAYLRVHGPLSLEFLAVFERTKKGWPHIHIVARCHWLDQKWLSHQMDALIGSPVVDVRRVHGKSKVAAYISKYISKNPERFIGVKRYWRSKNYLMAPTRWASTLKAMATPWEIVRCHFKLYAEMAVGPGVSVKVGRSEAVISWGVPP